MGTAKGVPPIRRPSQGSEEGSWPARAGRGILTLLVALASLSFCVGALAEDPSLPTLNVTSFLASYPPGVKPLLHVKLALAPTASAPWLVTTFDYGTLSIVRVTRDGRVLYPDVGPVDFLNDPHSARESQLTVLRPGQEADVPFLVTTEPFNSGYGIMAVAFDSSDEPFNPAAIIPEPPVNPRTIVPTPPVDRRATLILQRHLGFSYNLTRPGVYAVSLRYLYTGAQQGQSGVFSQELQSNEVSFELQ
jgi:hypothetical protein